MTDRLQCLAKEDMNSANKKNPESELLLPSGWLLHWYQLEKCARNVNKGYHCVLWSYNYSFRMFSQCMLTCCNLQF